MYTHDEILAMSEDELNHAIARVKGAKWWSIHPIDDAPEDARPVLSGYECMIQDDKGDLPFLELPDGSGVPNWTRDIGAAYQLEGEITDPMDQLAYMDFLATYSEHAETKFTRWNLIHASPKERSRAWLMWKEGRE